MKPDRGTCPRERTRFATCDVNEEKKSNKRRLRMCNLFTNPTKLYHEFCVVFIVDCLVIGSPAAGGQSEQTRTGKQKWLQFIITLRNSRSEEKVYFINIFHFVFYVLYMSIMAYSLDKLVFEHEAFYLWLCCGFLGGEVTLKANTFSLFPTTWQIWSLLPVGCFGTRWEDMGS